jgi:hypothetical protein
VHFSYKARHTANARVGCREQASWLAVLLLSPHEKTRTEMFGASPRGTLWILLEGNWKANIGEINQYAARAL